MNVTQHTSNPTTTAGLQYDHVLVPIDGSERSTIAPRTDRALAERLGATLHTVSVAADPADLVQLGTVDGVRSYLAAHPAGLLVASTRARDGLDRLVHGATAAGITAASTIATLVAPMPPAAAATTGPTVLIAVDGGASVR